MIIDLIAGARPNFMKIAPIIDAIKARQSIGDSVDFRLIHTGQHYDANMSGSFFQQLGIPEPDLNLGAGGWQSGRTNRSHYDWIRKGINSQTVRSLPGGR